MDIKTLLNNLHEEVSCSVCMNTFTDPKQLPCLHSFCLHCLEGIQRTSGRRDIILCPECRRECRVSSGNLNDLPTNFRINSLLDVLAIKECNTTGVKCGNCDKKSSQSFYCFQCCAFWCEANCVSLHNGIKANKDHRVLALNDFRDEDFENVLKRPTFCQKKHHEKDVLKFFCKDCEVPICNTCVVTLHEGHAKMVLEEAANERKLQVKSMIESQKQKVQQERNKIARLDESCIQIQERAATVKRDAQKFAEKMIGVIEAKKQEIFNKAESQAAESLERLVIEKTEIENQVKMTETAVEQTETLLTRSTGAEIVQLADKSFNTIFPEGVSNEGEQVDCGLEVLRQFVFVENETLMNKTNAEGVGSFKSFLSKTEAHQSSAEGKGITEAIVGLKAQFVLTTRNTEREQCYEERDHVTVEIKNRDGYDCTTKARVQDNKNGSYNISYFAKESGKYEATVKVNGEHISCSPFAVQVKPRQFRPVLSFGEGGSSLGMFSRPWGVAVNNRDEIAVTDVDNNRVQVFSSDGTFIKSFGRKGDKPGEFNCPTGIGFDKNGHIIVVDRYNHRVQSFSERGELLRQFGDKGSLPHQFNHPFGLSVDSDGNVIIADKNNKLIKMFSPYGQFLQKIGEGSFTFPIHCVQYNNHLIVSDSTEHCVKVFNRDGNFLYQFGKMGDGDGEFNETRCLTVNKAGHLMVCDRQNHRIQVFEPNGKFLAKFGKQGSKIGEFRGPISSAVLSDGRIVVADIDNNRIQVFE